ncbi:MAG: site-2 protease family protein [Planctomycetaceae bacterium]|nr:site-2 protease family protein [Planctomycetaceae bacterium]
MTLLGIANIQPTIGETIINVTIKVLLVIAGINALIIVHEFGHFIVARLCGVRCEKFYIWFDFYGLRFFKFKWGDTEYGLGLFPLGGYVKMLGQEDNPGELRAELERAKLQNGQTSQLSDESQNFKKHFADAASQTETRSAESLHDAIFARDSYLSKTVLQRLAIIVAGVVMNFIFAVACAAAAYLYGVIDTAPVIGNVVPGSPAWESGLQTGDKIKSINGNTVRAFMDVNMAAVGGAGGVDVVVAREVNGEEQTITKKFKPRKRPNDIAPMMGLVPSVRLNLSKAINHPIDSNAKRFYSQETLDKLKYGDLRLAGIGEKEITSYANYLDISLEKWGQPVEMTFVRDETEPAQTQPATTLPKNTDNEVVDQIKVTIPAIPVREVGLRFKMGEIVSVHPESDAAKKGIHVGDVIIAVDDVEDFDPLKLAYIVLQKVNAGQKSVRLKVRKNNELPLITETAETAKDVKNSAETTETFDKIETVSEVAGQHRRVEDNIKTVVVDLQPTRTIPQISFLSMQDPLGSTALGLAWDIEPVVVGYLPKASERAKLIPIGSKVISVKLVNSVPLLSKNSFSYVEDDGVVFHDIGKRVGLPYVLDYMLQRAITEDNIYEDNTDVDGKTTAGNDDTAKNEATKKDDAKKLSVQFEVIKPDGVDELFQVDIYDSSEYCRADRGLLLMELKATVTADGVGEAVQLGFAKTVEYALSVYVTLKRFYDGTVSPRALGGPILVVQSAYSFVSRGMGAYLLFLCIIGANLAVVNLLPIPPLDGGHVLFLAYEGIFRRPPSIVVQSVLSWAGLLLIVMLGLWVIALDCSFIPRF